jgi:TPP-dependent indolepyruvate ferredoxin oxidoreductase alpha subunit
MLLEELGAKVIRINCEPDGFNINKASAVLEQDKFKKYAKEYEFDFCAAVDGDGDRLVLSDGSGNVFNGDDVIYTIAKRNKSQENINAPLNRKPFFCSGCPHNTSLMVPEGKRALGGIGCHYMAVNTVKGTEFFTQMGGEGTPWIGISPFSKEKHIYANLGDGTYKHSGILAIRAALDAEQTG